MNIKSKGPNRNSRGQFGPISSAEKKENLEKSQKANLLLKERANVSLAGSDLTKLIIEGENSFRKTRFIAVLNVVNFIFLCREKAPLTQAIQKVLIAHFKSTAQMHEELYREVQNIEEKRKIIFKELYKNDKATFKEIAEFKKETQLQIDSISIKIIQEEPFYYNNEIRFGEFLSKNCSGFLNQEIELLYFNEVSY